MDIPGVVADGLSGASLVAVVIIGTKTLGATGKQTTATTELVTKTNDVAEASKRSAQATEQSSKVTERSAAATEQSVTATQEAVVVARQDTWQRHNVAVLEVLTDMRDLWNNRYYKKQDPSFIPSRPTDQMAGLDLMRRLEARLFLFDDDMPGLTQTRRLCNYFNDAANVDIEQAITEMRTLLRAGPPKPSPS